MDTLKKIFPLSFGLTELAKLILAIIIYAVIGVIGGTLSAFFAWFPLVGIPFVMLGSLIGIYVTSGIIIAILSYLKILQP